MNVGVSTLVLAKIEEIEALHTREREIYSEIAKMGEALGDNAWDKLAREIVNSRAAAAAASEDARDNLRSFDWMFESDDDSEPVEITTGRLWKSIGPDLRKLLADDKKSLQIIDQIDKLAAMTAEKQVT